MVLRMNEGTAIEDPRSYGVEVVNALRILLTLGVSAQPDPRREHFYELENGSHTLYIHISPINGEVMLLAQWLNSAVVAGLPASQLAA